MSIDDPGMKGGIDPDRRELPLGDTAGNTGGEGEPSAADLDLPGPNDPVAWNYIEPGTPVVGRDGGELGTVAAMLGTEGEGIFHGIAVETDDRGTRVVPADSVVELTPARVTVALDADGIANAEEHRPPEVAS